VGGFSRVEENSGGQTSPMKAIVRLRYGPPGDVLELSEIERPAINDDEVLVRVHAASIHVGDAHAVKGLPKIMRPIFSAIESKSRVPGSDIAGTVDSVGPNVTRLRPGDEVFGSCKGAFAEYAATSEGALALKPTNLTFEQASAIGVSAFTALQGLRDRGGLQPGQEVLINGASGGVGTFAVQIAKWLGADVTAVCSTRNEDMVRSIGADHVIDYTQTDFTQSETKYDLIFDNVGNHSLTRTRRALAAEGRLLSNGAPVTGWFGGLGHAMKATIVSLFVKQQARTFVSMANEEDLATLRQLAEAKEIKPVIDRTYPLDEAAKAMAHVSKGHARGKTIIAM